MRCVWLAVVFAFLSSAVSAQDNRLIDEGRRLFFEETFNGNGRTCGTCHPATNSFTIDSAFIATLLPEQQSVLRADSVPGLEDPNLIMQGLVLENLDGFDQPPVFRGVPHSLGLRLSIIPDPSSGLPHANATGWSGDGAPVNPAIPSADGSLRAFAIGAVIQHFPRTLNRVPGVDFRLPTNAELDAMLAFQTSTSRRADSFDLETARFTDSNADIGADIFSGIGTNRQCTACHDNAGALDGSGFNSNFDTGIRTLSPTNPDDGDGTGAFNTPPLVEAADTPPFFHNNSAATLEDAVAFYRSGAFANSPSGQFGGAFQLTDTQVLQVAAFLKALNVAVQAENTAGFLRAAARPERRAVLMPQILADVNDCIELLTQGPITMSDDAVVVFQEALVTLTPLASRAAEVGDTTILSNAARQLLEARDLIMSSSTQISSN